jgi:hypothetical protein
LPSIAYLFSYASCHLLSATFLYCYAGGHFAE